MSERTVEVVAQELRRVIAKNHICPNIPKHEAKCPNKRAHRLIDELAKLGADLEERAVGAEDVLRSEGIEVGTVGGA